MKGFHLISSKTLNFDDIKKVLDQNLKLKLHPSAVENICKCCLAQIEFFPQRDDLFRRWSGHGSQSVDLANPQ